MKLLLLLLGRGRDGGGEGRFRAIEIKRQHDYRYAAAATTTNGGVHASPRLILIGRGSGGRELAGCFWGGGFYCIFACFPHSGEKVEGEGDRTWKNIFRML